MDISCHLINHAPGKDKYFRKPIMVISWKNTPTYRDIEFFLFFLKNTLCSFKRKKGDVNIFIGDRDIGV